MLMNGMYPAIGGWHGDAYTRSVQYAQPDLTNLNHNIEHYVCVVGADDVEVSQTEFLKHPVTVAFNPKDVWRSVNRAVQLLEPDTWKARNREIYKMRQDNLHRATACRKPGWRLFMRMSIMMSEPRNEVRNQVQVYQLVGQEGW